MMNLFFYLKNRIIKTHGADSGSEFGNGNHGITYKAQDASGQKDYCQINFKVKGKSVI